MSAQGFYRFAAADGASEQFRAKAISYVMAGGLLSAIVGPQLNKVMFDFSVIPFLGSYIAIVALNLIGMFLFLLLDLPNAAAMAAAKTTEAVRTKMELLKTPRVAVAIICAMVSYALMNLVMTSTPLAVMGCGYTSDNANDIVSAHVLAMFIPSFFTGHLINRFGVERIMATGLIILGLAGLVALTGVTLGNFFAALILLGIGWNFGFIGATTMLASSHTVAERGVVQGMNDTIVFGCVTLASLASGGLMNCSGGSAIEGWNAVNIAMVPFLTLAGGALIWLALRPKSAH
jgi:MFS family permease